MLCFPNLKSNKSADKNNRPIRTVLYILGKMNVRVSPSSYLDLYQQIVKWSQIKVPGNKLLFQSKNMSSVQKTKLNKGPCSTQHLFPGAFFPVHVRGKLRRSWSCTLTFLPWLSFLAGGTLGSRLSLISFLSFCTSRSLGSSLPGCPGLLWLRHVHHGLVPQGNPTCHAYRGCHLSLVIHRNTLRPDSSEERIITVSSVKVQAVIK